MRKYIALVLTLVCVLALVGCEKNDTYKIRITIPAGSTEAFVYSDEEISATGKKITTFLLARGWGIQRLFCHQ